MSTIITIIVIYVVAGLAFAVLAFLAASRAISRGNALDVTIGSYRLKTSNVMVAQAVMSLVAMIGVPLYILYLYSHVDDTPLTLEVRLNPRPTTVKIASADDGQTRGQPQLSIFKVRHYQRFSVTEDPYNAVTVDAWYDELSQLHVTANDVEIPVKEFNGESGWIGPIDLSMQSTTPAPTAGGTVSTVTQAAPPSLHQLADPPSLSGVAP